MSAKERRNLAIIAHVDHGKTTLVDCLLAQSGTFRENQTVSERAMDSNDLEKERGITILAKVTSVLWENVRLNIVDTPGHADFGGEVERIMSMVDGVVLLVDAAEGPMPQTKFVLGKALKKGLNPILVINKIDKPDARADWVLDQTFDLFAAMGANEEQLDFPVLYASSKQGWAVDTLEDTPREDMSALFNLICRHVPSPKVEINKPFAMLATTLSSDPYLGRVLTGLVYQGNAKINENVQVLRQGTGRIEQGRLSKLLAFRGLDKQPVQEVSAGDIIAIAGLTNATVADTICALAQEEPITAQPIDPPTLSMTFSVNDSPLAGLEGSKVTSRMIEERLRAEAEVNVAIKITQNEGKDAFEVAGRGELQLAVLIENMRREGFELSVGRPRVVMQKDETGNPLEPIEEIIVDVDEDYSGAVVEKLSQKRCELKEMLPSGAGKTRLVFYGPTRAMIGYLSEFLTDTRGTGILNRSFLEYAPYRGLISGRNKGTLISTEKGKAVAYALFNLEDRGPLMITPGQNVYQGMIIGEHNKGTDLEVNPLKAKQLTNIRSTGADEAIKLTTPINMTLEKALSYIADDELVEVTPQSIRLRKLHLDPHDRKRHARKAAA